MADEIFEDPYEVIAEKLVKKLKKLDRDAEDKLDGIDTLLFALEQYQEELFQAISDEGADDADSD